MRSTYLHSGNALISSRYLTPSFDQIRIFPSKPLTEGVNYGLVLGAAQEISLRVEEQDQTFGLKTVLQTPSGIRMQFSAPVNPLSFSVGRVRLVRPDGSLVAFTLSPASISAR